jgi:hypothetical protein
MRANMCCFAVLLAVLSAAGFQTLPDHSNQLKAAPQAGKFEDLAQFKNSGGIVSGTGIRDKGGFTVVPMKATAGRSKLAVSLAVEEDPQGNGSDYRVVAVDGAGKRHYASVENYASAGGNGITVITVVSEFNLTMEKVDSLVIQQRAKAKK